LTRPDTTTAMIFRDGSWLFVEAVLPAAPTQALLQIADL
jgi:hypothetical protein